MASSAVVSVGPFGGVGGSSWDDNYYTTIRQIVIQCGDLIDAIQIEYDDQGSSKWGNLHGGSGGQKYVVGLKYPDEYLVSVSGHYGTQGAGSNTVLQSLTFQTNMKIYGPYGSERGVYFSFPTGIGKIVGFFGRSGTFLDAIGAYIEPFQNVRTVMPFGGSGGRVWDDGIHTGIKGLIIASGSFIDSITIKYDDNGKSLWSAQHGDSEGGTKYLVTFDYPTEYLTSISGYITNQFSNFEVLCSITIHTNIRTYGPYGKEEGTYFSTSSPGIEGKIIGLFGRAGDYVDALGAYVEP